jgi:phenolic acid decarboxylase
MRLHPGGGNLIVDKVKVGAITYEVISKPETLCLNQRECAGIINYEDATIRLNSNRSKQKVYQTFLHELFHAIFTDRDINVDNEEEIVDSLAKGLHQVIIDNPDLFAKRWN